MNRREPSIQTRLTFFETLASLHGNWSPLPRRETEETQRSPRSQRMQTQALLRDLCDLCVSDAYQRMHCECEHHQREHSRVVHVMMLRTQFVLGFGPPSVSHR